MGFLPSPKSDHYLYGHQHHARKLPRHPGLVGSALRGGYCHDRVATHNSDASPSAPASEQGLQSVAQGIQLPSATTTTPDPTPIIHSHVICFFLLLYVHHDSWFRLLQQSPTWRCITVTSLMWLSDSEFDHLNSHSGLDLGLHIYMAPPVL